MSLSEWTRGVLDATLDIALRMSRCGRAPLAELSYLVESELTLQTEGAVEHR